MEETRDLWNFAADSWSDFVDARKDYGKYYFVAPAMFDMLPERGEGIRKALDLCCGEGFYSRKLKEKGYEVYGVDIADKSIENARRKDADIIYHCADAAHLEMLEDGFFDLVFCAMALMDVRDLGGVIDEARRVLKSGGCFLFSITHPCFSFEKGGWEKDDHGNKLHFNTDNYFTEGEVEVKWTMPRLKYPFVTKGFHRTLSTYFNAVIGRGFIIEKVCEPYVDAVIGEKDLRDSLRIGSFIVVKCGKP